MASRPGAKLKCKIPKQTSFSLYIPDAAQPLETGSCFNCNLLLFRANIHTFGGGWGGEPLAADQSHFLHVSLEVNLILNPASQSDWSSLDQRLW